MQRRLGHDMLVGVLMGVGMAVFFAMIVGLQTLVFGQTFIARHGLTFRELVLIYGVGGLFGGILWGLLRPLNRSVGGAAINGTISIFPAIVLFVWNSRYAESLAQSLALSGLASAVGGGLMGIFCRLYYQGARSLPLDEWV